MVSNVPHKPKDKAVFKLLINYLKTIAGKLENITAGKLLFSFWEKSLTTFNFLFFFLSTDGI